MSERKKTVIVFSTYYNSPIFEDCLFNSSSSDLIPMSGEKLCDFLWKRLITDKYTGDDILNKMWSDYLINRDSINEDIVKKKKECVEVLYKQIKENPDIIKDLPSNWETIDFYKYPLWKAKDNFVDILKSFKNDVDQAYLTVLRRLKGTWISANLKKEGQQETNDICYAPGYNSYSKELIDKPLLAYRFSFCKLKESNDNTAVYAVWPLGSPVRNEGEEWIEALSEQFGTDADMLFLILHDKDIKDVAFEYYCCDNFEGAERYVILFQHDKKQIGPLLSKEHTIKEIEGCMERLRNYYLLNEAYSYLDNSDFENLIECCNKLPEKYLAVKEDAKNLLNASDNELLGVLEDKIINEIGKTRP